MYFVAASQKMYQGIRAEDGSGGSLSSIGVTLGMSLVLLHFSFQLASTFISLPPGPSHFIGSVFILENSMGKWKGHGLWSINRPEFQHHQFR